jgi:hypothetical protein
VTFWDERISTHRTASVFLALLKIVYQPIELGFDASLLAIGQHPKALGNVFQMLVCLKQLSMMAARENFALHDGGTREFRTAWNRGIEVW